MLEQYQKYDLKENVVTTVLGSIASCVTAYALTRKLSTPDGKINGLAALGIFVGSYAAGAAVDALSKRCIDRIRATKED
jgi:hypothetical protein